MFDVRGNTIYFRGEALATLLPTVCATLLGEACELIEINAEFDDLWAEHDKEIGEAYKKGYLEGLDVAKAA
jgi:hypothetical protein